MPSPFQYQVASESVEQIVAPALGGRLLMVPNFDFTAFFYPQLLEALLLFKRQYVPELTDESEEEVSIQLLRAFALVGHINNVILDVIANESTLPTARLPESVRNMLRLINYELRPATPSQADVVYKLSRTFASPFEIVPEGALVSTRREGEVPLIFFQATSAVNVDATDTVGHIAIKSPSGNLVAAGDMLYIGHASVMWDKMHIEVSEPSTATNGVWEYFDDHDIKTRPDAVTNLGAGLLELGVNTLLGPNNRSGSVIRVRLNSTTVTEETTSFWDGTKNLLRVSLLGQSVASTDPAAYMISSDWLELEGLEDGTKLLHESGDVAFDLPQTTERNWKKTAVSRPGYADWEGYFLRFRYIAATSGAPFAYEEIRIDVGGQYVLTSVTQGRTITNEVLGSSTGDRNQRFVSTQADFIDGSQTVVVNGQPWTQVTNFLNSGPQDRHYRIEIGENDRVTVVFGDGVQGRVPPPGQGSITMTYRYGAKENGNVGAGTISVDKQGLTFVERVFNPRPASGWAEAQSASDESLAAAKIDGPANLRIQEVALGPDDMVTLATKRFKDASGGNPFSRARAFEEGYGPKTTELILVARGGGYPSPTQLSELERYFNGDKTSDPPLRKRVVANQRVYCTSFEPRPVDVDAIVYGPRDLTPTQIENQLVAILQPEAMNEDDVSYMWEFGGKIPTSRIIHEVHRVDRRIVGVKLNTPPEIQLGARQLPVPGNFRITISSE